MNDKTIKINAIQRQIGTLMVVTGFKMLSKYSDFTTIETSNNKVYQALKDVGITLNFSPKDFRYRYTTWENWQEIIKVINGIVKHFPWLAQYFDCDNRSDLASALISLIYKINTCGKVYCEVFDAETGKSKYLHWANLIVDIDDSVYLWDLDNNRMVQKVVSANPVMGSNKYSFRQLIIN